MVQNLRNFQFIQHGCQQVHGQTMAVLPCMCSGFPTKIMEQMIVNHYMMSQGSLVLQREGSIKGEHTESGGFGCCSYCCPGVLTQALGSLLSTDLLPQLSECLSSRKHILDYSVVCFSISMHQDLFGGLLSYCDFIV